MRPVDIVYENAKEKEGKVFTFEEAWRDLTKKGSGYKKDEDGLMGSVYTDMLQDSRFIYMGSNKWMLREYASQDEINKLQNALYDFSPEVKEEGFEEDKKVVDLAEDEEAVTDIVKTTYIDEDDEEVYEDIKSNISNQHKDEGEE